MFKTAVSVILILSSFASFILACNADRLHSWFWPLMTRILIKKQFPEQEIADRVEELWNTFVGLILAFPFLMAGMFFVLNLIF